MISHPSFASHKSLPDPDIDFLSPGEGQAAIEMDIDFLLKRLINIM